MLIEAGPDVDERNPALLSPYPGRAYFDPNNVWSNLNAINGRADANDPDARPRTGYTQARLLGGGSSINGIGANRGAPSDFDEWAELGAKGWGWADVLPHFRKLERDLEFPSYPLHGAAGPIPVRRVPAEERSGFTRRVIEVLADRGVPQFEDQNGEWTDGVFPTCVNLDENWQRVSSAKAYLSADVRARPNLRVVTLCEIDKLVFDGSRVLGARTLAKNQGQLGEIILARETIICAGAIHTPALLLRSGIGPADHLTALGIRPIHDLRGVGSNLQEHPSAGLMTYLPARSRMSSKDAYHIPAIYRYSSGLDGCPQGDMHLAVVGRAAWHGIGRRTGLLFFWVNKSYSRGTVRLAGPSGSRALTIDFRMLSDERDAQRLTEAWMMAKSLLDQAHKGGRCGPPIPAKLSDRARKFGYPSFRNSALTGAAGLMLDLAGPLAPRLLETMVASGEEASVLADDRDRLARFLDESAIGVWHACGTCRMGSADDPWAVTTPDAKVIGIEGLRVCDASLFPTIPCANINLAVIMAAEHVAARVGRTE
jgi:5-(hydroxymethyl)furfural/furfural oxidase